MWNSGHDVRGICIKGGWERGAKGERNVFHIGVLILNHSCVVEAIQFSSANCDFKYN